MPVQITYVTTYDALDIRNWSGSGLHIAKSLLDQSLLVEYISTLIGVPISNLSQRVFT